MTNSLSMTTKKRPFKKGRLLWRVNRTPTGEMRFIPIEEKAPKEPEGGTIYATLTSGMMRNQQVDRAVKAISYAGGSVSSINGRSMTIEVAGENVEDVGETLESFGCQWDLN